MSLFKSYLTCTVYIEKKHNYNFLLIIQWLLNKGENSNSTENAETSTSAGDAAAAAAQPSTSASSSVLEAEPVIEGSIATEIDATVDDDEDDDLNIIREKELKELKSKSVVEKMNVFLKYYRQFSNAYIQRVQILECSDSLKIQFHSLIKCLNEYESLLIDLNAIVTEHERNECKNNHTKTKKFFNKSKAFIRYECSKRLHSNIFEYRRLINSQDRYAGMYDLIDMNNHLVNLLPDIGVSIRRYFRIIFYPMQILKKINRFQIT